MWKGTDDIFQQQQNGTSANEDEKSQRNCMNEMYHNGKTQMKHNYNNYNTELNNDDNIVSRMSSLLAASTPEEMTEVIH